MRAFLLGCLAATISAASQPLADPEETEESPTTEPGPKQCYDEETCKWYKDKEVFEAYDKCNVCVCNNGTKICTNLSYNNCSLSCFYKGYEREKERYTVGFKSLALYHRTNSSLRKRALN